MSVFALFAGFVGIALMVICIFLSGNVGGKSVSVLDAATVGNPVWMDDLIRVVDEVHSSERIPYGYVAAAALTAVDVWMQRYGPLGDRVPPDLVDEVRARALAVRGVGL